MRTKYAVFAFNLVQDVNVLRPLIYLAARDLDFNVVLLVSARFMERDWQKTWQAELCEIASHLHADIHIFSSLVDAFAVLQGKEGLILAGSESSVPGHAEIHQLFQVAPQTFRKITLQHGYECVGFLNNRQHDIAHGRDVVFAADVICGWSAAETLRSLVYSQRSKLYVTGPSCILQSPVRRLTEERPSGGLVCENLHSVRLRASGDVTGSFMEVFSTFCERLGERGELVNLRPHPGGQFVLKNNVSLPSNVVVRNAPIYKTDLAAFDYGLSAPSSVLIDFALANVPVAVWRDAGGVTDASNYDGLTTVRNVDDWLSFVREAKETPECIVENQQDYLDGLRIVREPAEVYRRFARLLGAPDGAAVERGVKTSVGDGAPIRRVFFVANGMIPTLQLSFYEPLRPLIDSGELVVDFAGETDLTERFKSRARAAEAEAWLASRITTFDPDIIVCCRYSGPHTERIAELAADRGIPLIFHVDDDLLNIPREIGEKKYIGHNRPERLAAVATLLDRADLVYCSTAGLKRRFRQLGFMTPMVAGEIYCAGRIIRPAERRPIRKFGYMGFDHAHDLAMVLPPVVQYLRRNTQVSFELFGSIPLPDELREFGDRIVTVPPVRDYAQFLTSFADREWDVGICPLVKSSFNEVKAITKWVEYTAVGAAVIASADTIYDQCGSDGRAILAHGDNEWLTALERLTNSPDERYEQVCRAQRRLVEHYNQDSLRRQVCKVFEHARAIVNARRDAAWPHVKAGSLDSLARPFNGSSN